jgi:DNA-directed RNA polymerase specialized sigma24 family protein
MNQKTFTLLKKADWGTVRRQLLIYATWRARHYRWCRGGDEELAEGKTVEDVVQEIIEKAFSGVRRWDPDKGELLPWLQAQSRSIIDALAKSASHRREVSILEMENLALAQSPDPLEIMLEKEAKTQICHQVETLFQAVDEEPKLRDVLECIMNNCEPKARYLADELDVPVEDIYNRLRRLRRCASRLSEGENSPVG